MACQPCASYETPSPVGQVGWPVKIVRFVGTERTVLGLSLLLPDLVDQVQSWHAQYTVLGLMRLWRNRRDRLKSISSSLVTKLHPCRMETSQTPSVVCTVPSQTWRGRNVMQMPSYFCLRQQSSFVNIRFWYLTSRILSPHKGSWLVLSSLVSNMSSVQSPFLIWIIRRTSVMNCSFQAEGDWHCSFHLCKFIENHCQYLLIFHLLRLLYFFSGLVWHKVNLKGLAGRWFVATLCKADLCQPVVLHRL